MTALYGAAIMLALLQRRFFPAAWLRNAVLCLANLIILPLLVSIQTLLALAVTALFCYGAALLLRNYGRSSGRMGARALLGGCILVLTLLLVILKYDGVQLLLAQHFPAGAAKFGLIETIGISYIFFKLIHCLVDAYRGELPALNPLTFINYIFFFPTYLSGPIDRYANFQHWLGHPPGRNDRLFFQAASFRILLGVVKKLILVPLLVVYAKDFGQVHISSVYYLNILISLFAYSGYLYCDFSGYSDLAIGAALFLGFKVPENFKTPYLARDIAEFWKRWHISLSSILREYIFLPLVRGISKHLRRVPRLAGTVIGYLITFVICGLWHGNTANFAVWGLWHGVGLSIHKIWRQSPWLQRLPRPRGKAGRTALAALATAITFVYVSVGWLFFNYSFAQIRAIGDFARLQPVVAPHYFYGSSFTWGLQLRHRPVPGDPELTVELRPADQTEWLDGIKNEPVRAGVVNIYGIAAKTAGEGTLASLPSGDYVLRLRYQMPADRLPHELSLPVTVPDYSGNATFTADDMTAKSVRLADAAWGIRLKYHPPAHDYKVDIEYRTPGSKVWSRYQYRRPGYLHYADIHAVSPAAGRERSLKPGVYGVRIRYTNMKAGYFSDWTELAVRVPGKPAKMGAKQDETG